MWSKHYLQFRHVVPIAARRPTFAMALYAGSTRWKLFDRRLQMPISDLPSRLALRGQREQQQLVASTNTGSAYENEEQRQSRADATVVRSISPIPVPRASLVGEYDGNREFALPLDVLARTPPPTAAQLLEWHVDAEQQRERERSRGLESVHEISSPQSDDDANAARAARAVRPTTPVTLVDLEGSGGGGRPGLTAVLGGVEQLAWCVRGELDRLAGERAAADSVEQRRRADQLRRMGQLPPAEAFKEHAPSLI